MKSLYIIQSEHQAILDQVQELVQNTELDAEQLQIQLDILQEKLTINAGEFQQKAEAYAAVIKDKQNRVAFLKSEAKRLLSMATAEESVIGRLQDRILSAMQAQGITKAETDHFKFGLRNNQSVEITVDATALPALFQRTKLTHEADKPAIKAALERGEIIPGAGLVTRQSLQIR